MNSRKTNSTLAVAMLFFALSANNSAASSTWNLWHEQNLHTLPQKEKSHYKNLVDIGILCVGELVFGLSERGGSYEVIMKKKGLSPSDIAERTAATCFRIYEGSLKDRDLMLPIWTEIRKHILVPVAQELIEAAIQSGM